MHGREDSHRPPARPVEDEAVRHRWAEALAWMLSAVGPCTRPASPRGAEPVNDLWRSHVDRGRVPPILLPGRGPEVEVGAGWGAAQGLSPRLMPYAPLSVPWRGTSRDTLTRGSGQGTRPAGWDGVRAGSAPLTTAQPSPLATPVTPPLTHPSAAAGLDRGHEVPRGVAQREPQVPATPPRAPSRSEGKSAD